MSSLTEQDAKRMGIALNDLGHIALGHPLEEFRRSHGAAKLRELVQESALAQVRDLAPSIDWEDAEAIQRLKAYARQAIEALGFGLPD